jgi:serine/threonine protein kinase
MACDVAEGMVYLHSRSPQIIHRDLKSHNLFVQQLPRYNGNGPRSPKPAHGTASCFVVKIGDWGSARAVALSGQRDPKTMTHGIDHY